MTHGFKTARSFAQALKIDENRYTRYERAEVEPDLQLLMQICGKLAITPNELLLAHARPDHSSVAWSRAGFAEDGFSAPQFTGRSVSSNPTEASGGSTHFRRRTIGWKIADLIYQAEAARRLDLSQLLSGPPTSQIQRTAQLLSAIDSDPFWVAMTFASQVDTSGLLQDEDQRLNQLVAELMAAVGTMST